MRSIEQSLTDAQDVTVSEKAAVPGNNVILTIDANLQKVAEESLEKTIKSIAARGTEGRRNGADADSGAVVALNVKTGETLAMASYPDFNPETFLEDYADLFKDRTKPMFNRL
jgi:penicillin-binding protein 2